MTTIKLTDNQVQAILYAMNITENSHYDYSEAEAKEYGHAATERAFDQIRTKLEKEGWE